MLGCLDYSLYNYSFYLFGTAFNILFLVYTAIFALSIIAMILGFVEIASFRNTDFNKPIPVNISIKVISTYMLLWAAGLGSLWIAQSISFIFTGKLPQIITDSGHPTAIVFALDLSLLIPFLFIGAYLLRIGKIWGLIISTILNVKGILYSLALFAMALSAYHNGIEAAKTLLPFWFFFTICSSIALVLLLKLTINAEENSFVPSYIQKIYQ